MRREPAAAITASLELIALRGVDPAPLIYARLFGACPELESLFVLGPQARGHMLDEAFRLILDAVGGDTYATAFLRSERVNHEDLGVAPEVFVSFFDVIARTLADMAGPDWTPEMAAAWSGLNAHLAAASGAVRAPSPDLPRHPPA